jgi:shikimate dehydrogenase
MTAISGRTRLIALIADPVAQARSPAMANTLLEERGQGEAFVMVPMQVPAGGLADVVVALRRIGNLAGRSSRCRTSPTSSPSSTSSRPTPPWSTP